MNLDRYLVVCVMVSPLVFDLSARRDDNEVGQLSCSNDNGPGPKLRKGEHHLTVASGWKQIRACISCLPSLLLYLDR